jgi:cytochrome c oxidase assembly protein subunit 15
MKVGMADPEWPSPPWYLLVVSWAELAVARGTGYLVEHGHRQIGWIVGVMTIVLAAWLWRVEERTWLRKLGLLALLAVCLQGLLGGLRVRWNASAGLELAMIHGCFGQLVFCLLASIALFTSRSWLQADRMEVGDSGRLRRLATLTTGLIVLQLAAGVWLRQEGEGLWVHLLLALAVTAHIVLLARRVLGQRPLATFFRRPALLLAGLLGVQLLLGTGTWWFGGGVGALDYRPVTADRAVLATLHVGVGALLLMTSLLLTLRTYRHLLPSTEGSSVLASVPQERTLVSTNQIEGTA